MDIWPGENNSSNPQNLISHGENIFFTADNGQNGTDYGIRTVLPPALNDKRYQHKWIK